jgi:DNA sulfur modification protein DndD
MILRSLILSNFGIYGRRTEFDLSPVQTGDFDRPIVIIRGQNGVGKSTVLEAIRLCFHGSLVIGSRVSRSEYLSYLDSRIHRPADQRRAQNEASIAITFDYVTGARRATYEVVRTWYRQGGKIIDTVMLTENGDLLPDLEDGQTDAFLREILPPSSTDVFFFDSERLHTLADDESSSTLFAESLKGLLGLHLVDRLVADLTVFLGRQSKGRDEDIQSDLDAQSQRHARLEAERADLLADQSRVHHKIAEAEKLLELQEQKIAGEGNAFSVRRSTLKQDEQRLGAEITKQRAVIQELTSGLFPFAIAPKLCEQVRSRIETETTVERNQASRALLQERTSSLEREMAVDSFWNGALATLPRSIREAITSKIRATLVDGADDERLGEADIVLHLSEKDRGVLTSWIDQALGTVPTQFSQEVARLAELEEALKRASAELSRIPEDDVLKPLLEELSRINQTLGSLQQQNKDYRDRLSQLDFEIEQTGWKLKEIRHRLSESKTADRRVQMAAKTQIVLEEYEAELLREKLHVLERAIVARFNELCRKESFLDAASINPQSFQLTLYRNNQTFNRSELSAGEKQLLATAQMWALREISGLPIPVVIDTPVGRLDSEHRRRMIRDYFPRASHQVILLTTDAELNDDAISKLEPDIARVYDLEFQATTATAKLTERRRDAKKKLKGVLVG